nr:ATP-binding protein [Pseudomarimonas arenosa]
MRINSLRAKFLWLTLPVMLLLAAVIIGALARQRSNELSQLHAAELQQYLLSDARLLSLPLWNLDLASAEVVLEQSLRGGRIECAQLTHVLGRDRPLQAGDCAGADLEWVEVDVAGPPGETPVGRLHLAVAERLGTWSLLREMEPQLWMLGGLLIALIACVMLAFRWLIITPLRRAEHSVRAYRERRQYLPVTHAAHDELGAFIREFNAGLERQQTAERDLNAQLLLHSTLNALLPLPLVVVDPQQQIAERNSAFIQTFGPRASSPGQRLIESLSCPALASLMAPSHEGAAEEIEITQGERCRAFIVHSARLPAECGGGWLLVFQDISSRIENNRRLAAAYQDTQRALDELQHAQDSLLRAEKLAALGQVVAGIAHEVNTPVGSSLTVASALSDKLIDFRQALHEGGLRRSTLDRFVAEVDEGCQLMLKGLQRAAAQIARFKQVAADQTSSQRREFDLQETIEEVISVLRPSLRRTSIQIELAIPADIVMDSYPGPLGGVVTNLFTNAVNHAFEDRSHGLLRIEGGRSAEDSIELRFIDDGNGIPEQHQSRIFDPFFTTKLGRGGTGLGLNLVYTTVTTVLGGTIAVSSELGKGSCFTITIPRVAPLPSSD